MKLHKEWKPRLDEHFLWLRYQRGYIPNLIFEWRRGDQHSNDNKHRTRQTTDTVGKNNVTNAFNIIFSERW